MVVHDHERKQVVRYRNLILLPKGDTFLLSHLTSCLHHVSGWLSAEGACPQTGVRSLETAEKDTCINPCMTTATLDCTHHLKQVFPFIH